MKTHTSIVDMACEALGISSRALAKFLDFDHSHLRKFHLGKRSVPNDILQTLVAFGNKQVEIPVIEALPFTELQTLKLQEEAAYCRAQCQRLQKRWDFLKKQQLEAANLLQRFDTVFKEPLPDWTDKKQRWLDEQRYQAVVRLEQASPINLKQLEIKIQLLQKEAELREQAIKL